MYGWRARVGIVVPCVNITMEPEFNLLAAQVPGISIHSSRMHLESKGGAELTVEALLDMEPKAIDIAVPELAHAAVDVIVYGCTSGSFAGGKEWNEEILNGIRKKTHIPATTTSTAVVEALRALGVKKVALGTPYDEHVTKLGKSFLESCGFQVVNDVGLDNLLNLRDASIELPYRLCKSIDTPEADCIFISCTQFPTINAISIIEADLGKPVVSSNLASFWHAAKLLELGLQIPGYGRLLDVE